jgi:hypothetical protein
VAVLAAVEGVAKTFKAGKSKVSTATDVCQPLICFMVNIFKSNQKDI